MILFIAGSMNQGIAGAKDGPWETCSLGCSKSSCKEFDEAKRCNEVCSAKQIPNCRAAYWANCTKKDGEYCDTSGKARLCHKIGIEDKKSEGDINPCLQNFCSTQCTKEGYCSKDTNGLACQGLCKTILTEDEIKPCLMDYCKENCNGIGSACSGDKHKKSCNTICADLTPDENEKCQAQTHSKHR